MFRQKDCAITPVTAAATVSKVPVVLVVVIVLIVPTLAKTSQLLQEAIRLHRKATQKMKGI